MPKRLVCTDKEKLEWQTYEDEPLGEGQVRIRTAFAAAKHGTEMAFYKGYALDRGVFDPEYQLFRSRPESKTGYPFAVGNMVVGDVIEVGPRVTQISEGDRVCAYSSFRETAVAHESRCWKMPAGMSWKSAVCLDPADFAMGAVRDGHVRVGDTVAVFGLGAIGLMAVQLARLAGAISIFGIDPLPGRRQIAESLGAQACFDPTALDVGLALKEATGKRGVDVVIEYSGSARALQQALRGVAYGGNIVLGAFPAPYPAGLDLGAEAHLNIPNLILSRACSQPDRDHPRWNEQRILDTCWKLLSEGRLTGEPIVQPVVAFDDLLTEYPKIASQPGAFLKLGAAV